MNMFLIFALVVVATAQSPNEVPTPKWTGPFADHVLGQVVHETPEVAQARAQLMNAHNEALAILPILPPEERYIPGPRPIVAQPAAFTPQTFVPAPQPVVPVAQQFFPAPQPFVPAQPLFPAPQPLFPAAQPIVTVPRFNQPLVPTILAEEIPRSHLGETPEVAAARAAHLAAVQQARNALPKI